MLGVTNYLPVALRKNNIPVFIEVWFESVVFARPSARGFEDGNSSSAKKYRGDSCAAVMHTPDLDRPGVARDACRWPVGTSFPVGPGKSIQRLRHDATSSIHVGSGTLHGDYHIACHIVGAPREGERRRRREKGEGGGERGRGREGGSILKRDGNGTGWRRNAREEDVDANRIAICPRARHL